MVGVQISHAACKEKRNRSNLLGRQHRGISHVKVREQVLISVLCVRAFICTHCWVMMSSLI